MEFQTLEAALEAGGPSETTAQGTTDRCEVAKQVFRDARRELEHYRWLIFIVAVVFAGFLVAAIVLFAMGQAVAGLVSLVGTVANGAGMAWIVAQRKRAASDQEKATKLVDSFCPAGTTPSL